MPEFLPFVRRWFAETFSEPTRPQREVWEAIASGRDTLIVAPTGSGKTLAAFLWALDHLHRLGLEGRLEDRVYVVYVSPLRALNNDIEKNLRAPLAGIQAAAAADGTRLPEVRVAVRTGDTLAAARQAMTRRPPHILITTPESLYILLTSERFRPALARTRFVIVDEVHALMGGKRGAHLALSLERLAALVEAQAPGARPQRIGCSATVSPLDATLDFLTGATARDPVVVDIGFARELDLRVVAPVDDFLTATSDTIWDATLQLVAELVQTHRTTLVFAQSRRAAERIARDLNDRIADGRVAAHHGSLSRRARLEAENRLKEGELRALVATSSLELGIDVGAIDLVVQLQSPRNIAAALQRVGRAGHLLSRVSKGRIVVTRGEELGEAAAVVRSIPDAGLFDVFVAETDLKVGTLDEEFVTESLPGDVFLLGSHAWRIVKVRADRVLVEDAQGMSPTIPFWKGEHPSRSWELGLAVGRLRRDAADRLDTPDFAEWAERECGLDARATTAMHGWLVKAGEVLQGVADDQGIVVESFSDEMGGRHAMMRALFIPRMTRGQRTPAYLQRLKADALLEAVKGQPDFPVVAETLRECFNDAYDVPRLKRMLERLHDREMWTRHVDTPVPSPFVYPLLLAWDWAYLDAGHAEERRSDTIAMRKNWSVAPGPLRPEIIAAVEAELQRTTPERRARDANELAAILDDLGDLTRAEIGERGMSDADALIAALLAERRITLVEFGARHAWIPATDAPLYAGLATEAGLERIALRALRTRGPVTAQSLAERYGLTPDDIQPALERLVARGVVRRGDFMPEG